VEGFLLEVEFQDCPSPLDGYWWENDEMVCLPLVASKGHPRALLAFLSSLEDKGKKVFVPSVINARLAKLLELRGYTYSQTAVFDEQMQDWVDGYTKVPSMSHNSRSQ